MSKKEFGTCLCNGPLEGYTGPIHPRPSNLVARGGDDVQCPVCFGLWRWVLSTEEIIGRPDGLFSQDLWRPEGPSVLQVLYETNKVPRVRSAVSDSHVLTESTAAVELGSIREWWDGLADSWVGGTMTLVTHAGLPRDELEVWMDINLVVPFFQDKLGAPVSLEEINLMTAHHRLRGVS